PVCIFKAQPMARRTTTSRGSSRGSKKARMASPRKSTMMPRCAWITSIIREKWRFIREMVASGVRNSARGVKPRTSANRMTTSRFTPPIRLASGRLSNSRAISRSMLAPEGIADEVPLFQARHHVIESRGQLADFIPAGHRQKFAVISPGYLGGLGRDAADGPDHRLHPQADKHQNNDKTKNSAHQVVQAKADNGGQDLAAPGVQHDGPRGGVEPVIPDHPISSHERAGRLFLHGLEHVQLQGVPGLPQTVP